jgi:hypothetical protein
VKVRAPGATRFTSLDAGGVTQIPVGSLVDTTKGSVSLTLAKNPRGAVQAGTFKGGQFKLRQSRARKALGLTELRLAGPSLGRCPLRRARGAATRREHRLFSSVHGRFRTRGRHSTATVRGTRWLTKDTCAGTLTRVSSGVVMVRDLTLRRTFRLKKGQQHLALPKRLKRRR